MNSIPAIRTAKGDVELEREVLCLLKVSTTGVVSSIHLLGGAKELGMKCKEHYQDVVTKVSMVCFCREPASIDPGLD